MPGLLDWPASSGRTEGLYETLSTSETEFPEAGV
jgi:hypothetical protein